LTAGLLQHQLPELCEAVDSECRRNIAICADVAHMSATALYPDGPEVIYAPTSRSCCRTQLCQRCNGANDVAVYWWPNGRWTCNGFTAAFINARACDAVSAKPRHTAPHVESARCETVSSAARRLAAAHRHTAGRIDRGATRPGPSAAFGRQASLTWRGRFLANLARHQDGQESLQRDPHELPEHVGARNAHDQEGVVARVPAR
jgi:hypothetical protein